MNKALSQQHTKVPKLCENSNALRRAVCICVELVYSIYGIWLTLGAAAVISFTLPNL